MRPAYTTNRKACKCCLRFCLSLCFVSLFSLLGILCGFFLLIELISINEGYDSHFGTVTTAGTGFENTGIATVSVGIKGCDFIKELINDLFLLEECECTSLGGEGVLLA